MLGSMCCRFVYAHMYVCVYLLVGVCFVHIRNSSVSVEASDDDANAHIYGNYHIEQFSIKKLNFTYVDIHIHIHIYYLHMLRH